jgi:hypothetical protein
MMKLLKAKQLHPKKRTFQISDLSYVKNGIMLQDILDGKEMLDCVEIEHDTNPNYDKEYFVYKGSSRIEAAVKMGYTHIEGIII